MPEQDSQSVADPRPDAGTDDAQVQFAMDEINHGREFEQDNKDQPGFLESTPAPTQLGTASIPTP
ncbi:MULTISPECIES: hypothetical protein [Bifidobacterium]|uniref:Uncharacterized protein n=1 Tax=Bifidobacterium apousia TaxID=2750996 RepID=A0A556R3U2_9BIFI|nr:MULTISPECIES: hypothetical protein [Bifidobacterium]MBI0136565.1 hypothetical protein [Bifidobacterium sp. W8120]TSJ83557.1 hypothetical protein FPK30_04205 [Bifidobacterium apousia]